MKRHNLLCAPLAAALLIAAGCGSSSSETERKLAEAEKKLAETQQKLAEATGAEAVAASGGTPSAPAINPPAVEAPSAKTAPPPISGAANQAGKATERAEPKPAKPPAPTHYTLEAGTSLNVRTTSTISTKTSNQGSIFEASLMEPLVVNGHTIAEQGASVQGVVTTSDPGGRVKGVASIAIALNKLTLPDGRVVNISTTPRSFSAKSSKKKDALKVGIASGVGAAIGAIAGGGKGAAIGAGAGGAGGAGVVLGTRGEAAQVPAETPLTFRLSSDVRVAAR